MNVCRPTYPSQQPLLPPTSVKTQMTSVLDRLKQVLNIRPVENISAYGQPLLKVCPISL